MSRWKKVLLSVALIALCILAFLGWYRSQFSMEVAASFQVEVQNPEYRLLIATQGSDFKNALVESLITELKERPISIRVIDVSGLSAVDAEDWSAVVVLHTWENWQPQPDARQFLRRLHNHDRVVVLTTSGGGDEKIDGVDAITSASKMSDLSKEVADIIERLNAVFLNIDKRDEISQWPLAATGALRQNRQPHLAATLADTSRN